jgi:hypothetical protein
MTTPAGPPLPQPESSSGEVTPPPEDAVAGPATLPPLADPGEAAAPQVAADAWETVAPAGPARPGAPGGPAVPGYEVAGEVGRGGMGVVYWARHR